MLMTPARSFGEVWREVNLENGPIVNVDPYISKPRMMRLTKLKVRYGLHGNGTWGEISSEGSGHFVNSEGVDKIHVKWSGPIPAKLDKETEEILEHATHLLKPQTITPLVPIQIP